MSILTEIKAAGILPSLIALIPGLIELISTRGASGLDRTFWVGLLVVAINAIVKHLQIDPAPSQPQISPEPPAGVSRSVMPAPPIKTRSRTVQLFFG